MKYSVSSLFFQRGGTVRITETVEENPKLPCELEFLIISPFIYHPSFITMLEIERISSPPENVDVARGCQVFLSEQRCQKHPGVSAFDSAASPDAKTIWPSHDPAPGRMMNIDPVVWRSPSVSSIHSHPGYAVPLHKIIGVVIGPGVCNNSPQGHSLNVPKSGMQSLSTRSLVERHHIPTQRLSCVSDPHQSAVIYFYIHIPLFLSINSIFWVCFVRTFFVKFIRTRVRVISQRDKSQHRKWFSKNRHTQFPAVGAGF